MLEPRSRLSHTQDPDVLHGASVVLSPTDFASHWVLVLVQKEEEDELQREARGKFQGPDFYEETRKRSSPKCMDLITTESTESAFRVWSRLWSFFNSKNLTAPSKVRSPSDMFYVLECTMQTSFGITFPQQRKQ